jgi:hypothetical protein
MDLSRYSVGDRGGIVLFPPAKLVKTMRDDLEVTIVVDRIRVNNLGNRNSRTHRLLAIFLILFTIVACATDVRSLAASAAVPKSADGALQGRLGGTRASFLDHYGAPTVENEVNGSRYVVDGFGMVLVQFRQLTKTVLNPGERATVVTLRSPRADDVPATSPDSSDWSIDRAFQALSEFLPKDVALEGSTVATPDTSRQGFERSCVSNALAAAFPNEPAPGVCQIAFLMPTAVSVSYITLILGADDESAQSADSCSGMRAWGQTTGARMESALSTLSDIAKIDENDPNAPKQLRASADRFTELSAAQSGSETPRAAKRASEQLVTAFDGFAEAIRSAADGLE